MEGGPPRQGSSVRRRVVLVLAVLLAVTPMVVGAADAIASDWVPFGDEAALGVRADDVFSPRSPLLGMPASSVLPGDLPNHPGPLLYWWYAPFVEVAGIGAGLVVGAALLGALTATAIVLMTFQRAGLPAAVGSAVLIVALVASLYGAAPIVSPLNADVVLLPLLFVCFLAWWIADGERRLVPVAIVVASLVAQAYLPYLPAAAGALVVSAGFLLHDRRRHRHRHRDRRRPDPPAPPAEPSDARRADRTLPRAQLGVLGVLVLTLAVATVPVLVLVLVVAVAVGSGLVALTVGAVMAVRRWVLPSRTRTWSAVALAACWAVPLAEAAANHGGNVAALWREARAPTPTEGVDRALEVAATAGRLPPLVSDHISEQALANPPLGLAVVGVALGVVLIAWAARRRSRDDLALMLVAAGALVAGALSVARAPADDAWIAVRFNWVLVVSAFWTYATVRTSIRWADRRVHTPTTRRTLQAVAAGAAALVLAVGLPQALSLDDNYEPWLQDAVPSLGDDVAEVYRPDGRVLVLEAGGVPYWELARGLTADLSERGWTTATENLVHYFGPARDARVLPVDAVVHVVPAELPLPPEGGRRLASYRPEGWDPVEARRLAAAVRAHVVAEGPLELTEAGAADLHQHLYGHVPGACEPARWQRTQCVGPDAFVEDPQRLLDLDPSLLVQLYRAGAIRSPVLPEGLRVDLALRTAALPVDVFVVPSPGAAADEDRATAPPGSS